LPLRIRDVQPLFHVPECFLGDGAAGVQALGADMGIAGGIRLGLDLQDVLQQLGLFFVLGFLGAFQIALRQLAPVPRAFDPGTLGNDLLIADAGTEQVEPCVSLAHRGLVWQSVAPTRSGQARARSWPGARANAGPAGNRAT
jgi:hypothetical protein